MACNLSIILLLLFLWSSCKPSLSHSCASHNPKLLFDHCADLKPLSSTLHFSFNSSNSTLSLVFSASPGTPTGWISWAVNPSSAQMPGAQALAAFKSPSNESIILTTMNITSRSLLTPAPLSFPVWDTWAESDAGVLRIHAKVKLPVEVAKRRVLNQIWQVGPTVSPSGRLSVHRFEPENLKAIGVLDLATGTATNGDRRKYIHGMLNAVSWGFLIPIGVMIARYMKTFETTEIAWFYIHVFCQMVGFCAGAAGWATGVELGRLSSGATWTTHRTIGTVMFALATVQMIAIFLRPSKGHRYRFQWNVYHWGVGYSVLVLGVVNIYKGFEILQPERKWKELFTVGICVIGGVAVVLEIVTCVVVMRLRSQMSSFGSINLRIPVSL